MDIAKIKANVESAEQLIDGLKANEPDGLQMRQDVWKEITNHLSTAKIRLDDAHIRSKIQCFLRDCILERVERLEREARDIAL